jgi:hypothetical protein
VAADMPTLLIEANLLDRNLHNDCIVLLDPSGMSYDVGRGLGRSRPNLPAYQRAMLDYFDSADVVLLGRVSADGLSSATWTALRERFRVLSKLGIVTVLTR